ncbi:hypothetical protein C8Q78DRAFT_382664 [Trametes maxima]|nr:hypothetical protein C8Q78DRAFT_382664 [Trametes maxima]
MDGHRIPGLPLSLSLPPSPPFTKFTFDAPPGAANCRRLLALDPAGAPALLPEAEPLPSHPCIACACAHVSYGPSTKRRWFHPQRGTARCHLRKSSERESRRFRLTVTMYIVHQLVHGGGATGGAGATGAASARNLLSLSSIRRRASLVGFHCMSEPPDLARHGPGSPERLPPGGPGTTRALNAESPPHRRALNWPKLGDRGVRSALSEKAFEDSKIMVDLERRRERRVDEDRYCNLRALNLRDETVAVNTVTLG